MDYCTAMIQLNGDSRQEVPIDAWNARSYAEIVLLRALHGGAETVRNVQVVAQHDVDPSVLKDDLAGRYGALAQELYPGYRPTMPESAADDPFPASPLYADPAMDPNSDEGKKAGRGKRKSTAPPPQVAGTPELPTLPGFPG